ncbi:MULTISPECIES: STAS domain-containing protein [unclassified Sphingomonas]|uniref:STAS domain-containing protein n=1 Tax=unclassified Sphingomonas TaxID=196159 RepID=UPI00226AE06E|nr:MULTISPECIES: STAS domain-containing protein [unclassified Sphingomonas]
MKAHQLAASLDTAAAEPLRAALLGRIESRQPLLLDGAEVMRVGMACLQVLASARASAIADRLSYDIGNASMPLREMATLAGFAAVLEPVT